MKESPLPFGKGLFISLSVATALSSTPAATVVFAAFHMICSGVLPIPYSGNPLSRSIRKKCQHMLR